jgi:hypothetical protein
MNIPVFCVFHIEEDGTPIILESFTHRYEADEYMIEREGEFNFYVSQTFCFIDPLKLPITATANISDNVTEL